SPRRHIKIGLIAFEKSGLLQEIENSDDDPQRLFVNDHQVCDRPKRRLKKPRMAAPNAIAPIASSLNKPLNMPDFAATAAAPPKTSAASPYSATLSPVRNSEYLWPELK